MQRISPFLWFDTQAEQAARFYVSIFENSKILSVARYNDAVPEKKGRVMVVTFKLAGQTFTALNGGPGFPFTNAVSFYVNCKDQAEVDYYWKRLVKGGEGIQCGWLRDRYGLRWQIVPLQLTRLLADKDPAKTTRAMQAMFHMVKLDVKALTDAAKAPKAPRRKAKA